MKKIVMTLMMVFGLGLLFSSCEKPKKENGEEKQEAIKHDDQGQDVDVHEHGDELAMTVYQCPMQCEGDKTYSEKGSCPVCEMDLKELEATEILEKD